MAVAAAGDAELTRIAFGSCADQNEPQPIWDAVLAADPELFVFLGDNVYGDTENMDELRAAYALLDAQPGYAKLKATVPIIAIWDDHDYGVNDGGWDYPQKAASKRIFLDFFGEPADSPRRKHAGVYTAYIYGPNGRRVQVILPDLRYFRSTLETQTRSLRMKATHVGPYLPSDGGTYLGSAQWDWLDGVLLEPADLRILASSSQVLPEGGAWESWANFPAEKNRLLDSLGRAGGTIIVSGDMHWAELSRFEAAYPLIELTTSGLTKVWKGVGPNTHRVGAPYLGANFGLITINWEEQTVRMEVRDVHGKARIDTSVAMGDLRAHPVEE